jgi:hypothetical protein
VSGLRRGDEIIMATRDVASICPGSRSAQQPIVPAADRSPQRVIPAPGRPARPQRLMSIQPSVKGRRAKVAQMKFMK